MEDCRESLDGESASGEGDEVSSNLDVVELESRPSSSSTMVASATTTTQQMSALPRNWNMAVTGPAGILAFYILSAIGCPGLFYRSKSPFLAESTELAKLMAIPLCSVAAFIILRHLCQSLYLRSKPVLPAEQIVMDVKRMNINFTLLGGDREKPVLLSKVATSQRPSKPSTFAVSVGSPRNNGVGA